MGRWVYLVATVRDGATWQLATLPTQPQYWLCTPTEKLPLLRNEVSSQIHVSMGPRRSIAFRA